MLLFSLLIEQVDEVFEVVVSLNFGEVLEHDDVAELIVAVKVVAQLLHESRLAHIVAAFDVHHWAWLRRVGKLLDALVDFNFAPDENRLILGHSDELTSLPRRVNHFAICDALVRARTRAGVEEPVVVDRVLVIK